MFLLACHATAGELPINQPVTASDAELPVLENITWPMLPGESLKSLSAKLFPDNEAMQAAFIAKTIKLNADETPPLEAEVYFTAPKAIRIPNPKRMRSGIHSIKPAGGATSELSLRPSYRLSPLGTELPKKMHPVQPSIDVDRQSAWLDQTVVKPVQAFFSDLSIENAKEKLFGNPVGTGGLSLAYQEARDYFDAQDKTRLVLWAFAIMTFLLGVYLPIKAKRKLAVGSVTPLERQEPILVVEPALQASPTTFDETSAQQSPEAETQVDEYTDQLILEEAKKLAEKKMAEEAIAHMQWAIRAKPNTSIVIWLYMLDLLKQLNHRETFEQYAAELHQQFNVIAPAWAASNEEGPSLESHAHIEKRITTEWPVLHLKPYLQNLIKDNRDGERAGFSQAEIEEILTLINVLEARNEAAEVSPETASADHSDSVDPVTLAE
jgi:hypothetical protein